MKLFQKILNWTRNFTFKKKEENVEGVVDILKDYYKTQKENQQKVQIEQDNKKGIINRTNAKDQLIVYIPESSLNGKFKH